MMKIQGKPFNRATVQVYAPASASTDDELEEFYDILESTLDHVKSNEVLVVMGNLNANEMETLWDIVVCERRMS